MGKLWLIRHGQASFGSDDYDALSETGFRQAEITGRHFARAGIWFDAACTGSLRRQQETARTARVFQEGIPIFPEPAIMEQFNEYDFIKIINSQLPQMIDEDPSIRQESKSIFDDHDVFVKLFSIMFTRWLSGRYDIPGVETFRQYQQRIMDGIHTLIHEYGPGKQIAVFTSGGVIGALLQMVMNLSPTITMETGWQIRNASVTALAYRDTDLVLSCFNSIAHLEAENDPDLITFR